MFFPRRSAPRSTTVWLVLAVVFPTAAQAQATAKPKPKLASATELKRLDAKMESLRETFFRDTSALIKGYEDAGQPERAKVLLEALGRLDPKNDLIKQKLADLRLKILDANEFEFDLDPAKPWQAVGPVTKDTVLRIRATGGYQCSVDFSAGPDGVATVGSPEDVVANVPLGAVMGVIAGGAPEKDGKPPKPFTVGAAYEKPAERDGLLLLKVNLPPKSECTGRLKLAVSGPTRTP